MKLGIMIKGLFSLSEMRAVTISVSRFVQADFTKFPGVVVKLSATAVSEGAASMILHDDLMFILHLLLNIGEFLGKYLPRHVLQRIYWRACFAHRMRNLYSR